MDLKKNNINIHICSMKAVEMHTHDFLELAYVIHGSATHNFNGSKKEIISEGDYFIIDYRTNHSYESIDNCDFSVINCLFLPQLIDKSLAYCKNFQTLLQHYLIQIGDESSKLNISNHIFHDENGKILNILKEMLTEFEQNNIGWIEIMRSKLIELLIITARKLSNEKTQDIVSSIILRIHQNYNQNLTLGKIAAEMNYSLPHISRIFKEKSGMTFREYLQKTRINEACRILANTNEKTHSISEMVGYRDFDFFCKKFKEYTGTTPKKFRLSLKAPDEQNK